MKYGAVGSLNAGDLSLPIVEAFFNWSISEESGELYPYYFLRGSSLRHFESNGRRFPYLQSDVGDNSFFSFEEFSRCVNIKYALTSLPKRFNTGLLWGGQGMRPIEHGSVEFNTNLDGALRVVLNIQDDWLVQELAPGYKGMISVSSSVGYFGIELFNTSDRAMYEDILRRFDHKHYLVARLDDFTGAFYLSPFEWTGRHNIPYMLPTASVVAADDVLDFIYK